jgi:curved DNA-binding protein CbpA
MALTDPYKVLEIPHSATDAEIRAAYRRQVQLHHPDHNGGSAESTRRFERVQEAYALILKLDRGTAGGRSGTSARAGAAAGPDTSSRAASSDPGLEQRLADLQRELDAQRAAKQEAARRAERIRADALRQAREAARATDDRPSDDDLGYVTTDDSFSAILDDAAAGWSKRLFGDGADGGGEEAEAKREPVNERLADLFDDLGSRLRGDKPKRDG